MFKIMVISSLDVLNRGPSLSAHVLLNLLNELGKKIRCEALPRILWVSSNELINSIIQEHEYFISSQCARGKLFIARKPEVHRENL